MEKNTPQIGKDILFSLLNSYSQIFFSTSKGVGNFFSLHQLL